MSSVSISHKQPKHVLHIFGENSTGRKKLALLFAFSIWRIRDFLLFDRSFQGVQDE